MLARFADLGELHIAHNTYVSVMAEMGLPGIVLFLAAAAATFVSLERVRRTARATPGSLVAEAAEALQVGLVAFLAAAFFVSAETHRLFWLVVFVSMVLPQLVRTEAESRRDNPHRPVARTLSTRPVRSVRST
jgi:O-antigen ligase